jgi:hypothetical protein
LCLVAFALAVGSRVAVAVGFAIGQTAGVEGSAEGRSSEPSIYFLHLIAITCLHLRIQSSGRIRDISCAKSCPLMASLALCSFARSFVMVSESSPAYV